MGALRAFARFWAGFVVGDDPLLAAVAGLGIAAPAAAAAVGLDAWWALPPAVVGACALSLRRAVARGG